MTGVSPKLLYRFVYFNVRGAGELCRLTLAASGADWEDVRYPMALAATGFSYDPSFRRDADSGAFDVNMGSLPILQVVEIDDDNGQRLVANLGQSHSIAKFVAAKHGLYGIDALEQARIDALYENCRDIKTQWYRTKRNKEGKDLWFSCKSKLQSETGKDNLESMNEDVAPNSLEEHCRRLEKAISASREIRGRTINSPWCMGGSDPSLADVAVYHLLGIPKPSVVTGSVPSFFDGESERIRQAYSPQECPRLFDCVSAFSELDTIKQWETKRPETFT